MKQANYNGRLREALAALGVALAALGVALTASHRLRGAICLDIIILPPHVASLRAAQYGVTHGCDPSGVPYSHLRANVDAVCVPCDAASSLAADGNQHGEFAMPLCPIGRCSVAPRISPRFARLNTGLRTAATPPGCPARTCEQMAMPLACPAMPLRASLPMGTNAASLRCRFALSGGVALPFHNVNVRF